MSVPADRALRALVDAIACLVEAADLQQLDPEELRRCRQKLLRVLESLSHIQAHQPAVVATASYEGLSAVEAARRLIWWCGRPMATPEILELLTSKGWRSRPTKTPVSTLGSDLAQAHHQLARLPDRRWALTPAGEQLERARCILEAESPKLQTAIETVLKAWTRRSRG